MFENIHNKVNIENQERNEKGLITSKKKGRPKAPNMKPVQIKMDASFHAFVKSEARKMGLGVSALVTVSLKSYFDKATKQYKIVET